MVKERGEVGGEEGEVIQHTARALTGGDLEMGDGGNGTVGTNALAGKPESRKAAN